ncbi:hypothetical protein CBR_g51918 [Chara braunii]|uniref:Uncharacterized protein n=1 Tax=Chara braunii TaxID=69332 RepID=A0A388M9C0_CHABU|nr:hypothetical protein CBR_g51918 [Chara braunii]|eukprot:GBG91115.1 hypothetical protein CBR_g51918 [Chara braunii]
MHRVGSTGNTAGARRKERRLTYVLRNSRDSKHCSGVNALLLANEYGRPAEGGEISELDVDAEVLFSAGRDGTVKRWTVNGAAAAECSMTFESHVDWVNDIVLIGSDTLVSCSSDMTIKTWRAFSSEGSKGECTRTLRQHSDYVKALAAARQTNLVASGGLRCEVFVWDLEGSTVPVARAPMNDGASPMHDSGAYAGAGGMGVLGMPAGNSVHSSSAQDRSGCMGAGYSAITRTPVAFKGHKESVYALAMNDDGTVLASGGTEKAIRIWDPRTGAKQMKLKGHSDNIRCLLLDPAGRCFRMLIVMVAYSLCCLHSLATGFAYLVLRITLLGYGISGSRGVMNYVVDRLCLAVPDEGGAEQPAGTAASSAAAGSGNGPCSNGGSVAAGTTGASEQGNAGDGGNAQASTASAGAAPGTKPRPRGPLVEIMCNDQDMAGEVCLWEITNGRIKQRFGNVSLEEKEKELFEKVSVPSWFTMDTRLGSISVHLDVPQCFAAEMYAIDLCVPSATEEMKLNLGEHTLRGLFCHWLARRQQRLIAEEQQHVKERLQMSNGTAASREGSEEGSVDGKPSGREAQAVPSTMHGGGGGGGVGGGGGTGTAASSGAAAGSTTDQADGPLSGVLPAFDFPAECPPSIITEGSAEVPWRKAINELDGTEDERDIPHWCLECLLHKRFHREPSNAKCSFYLHPCDGSQLPCLSQSKLSAPKILRIQKAELTSLTESMQNPHYNFERNCAVWGLGGTGRGGCSWVSGEGSWQQWWQADDEVGEGGSRSGEEMVAMVGRKVTMGGEELVRSRCRADDILAAVDLGRRSGQIGGPSGKNKWGGY